MKDARCLMVFGSVVGLLLLPLYCAANPNPLSLKDFEALLEQHPVDGIPLSRFEEFREVPDVSAFAGQVLTEKKNAREWSNAVFALGAIGDQKAKKTIDVFLRSPTDPLTGGRQLSTTAFNAKVDCLFALGYMVLHSPDQRVKAEAKVFLDQASALSAQIWGELEWESPTHHSKEDRNAYLVGKVRLVNAAIAQQSAQSNGRSIATMARAKQK